MEQKLINLIKEKFNLETLDLDMNFEQLGISSIGFIELIIDIEKLYKTRIPDSLLNIESLGTVNKIISELKKLGV